MRYAFFRGCFIQIRLPHLEKVSRLTFERLGVELFDVDEFSCCSEPVGLYTNDPLTSMAVAARNISYAEEEGLDILSLCNGCSYVLKQVNEKLKQDDTLREQVNDILSGVDCQYKGTVEVKHFAEILSCDIGAQKISNNIEKPLNNLKVAGHTGCHILSPRDVMAFDNPLDPVVLDSLISVLGAEPLDYTKKTLCCGWTLSTYGSRDSANDLLEDKLESMRKADCISVICPQCFYQFDTGQMIAARKRGLDYRLPVYYYLQLLGLSMGFSLDEMLYLNHRVKENSLQRKLEEILS
jgi:heterodisulfide reductase subunit B